MPFFLAVLCKFMEPTGIAAEFPYGFMGTVGGWLCHIDLHACLNPQRPDQRTRPRILSVVTADSNSGKSPFYDLFVKPIFLRAGLRVQSCLVGPHVACQHSHNVRRGTGSECAMGGHASVFCEHAGGGTPKGPCACAAITKSVRIAGCGAKSSGAAGIRARF